MTDPQQPQQPYPAQYQYPPAQQYAVGPYGYAYDGPPGKARPTGVSILLFVVTFGIYGYVYNYLVHDEMKKHSGRGVGGGIALLLTFLAGIAMPFITPHEVGNLYERKGLPQPVKAWTGLWYLVPMAFLYVGMIAGFVALFASSETDAQGNITEVSSGGVIGLVLAIGIGASLCTAGAVTWFVKTNGALNRYWQTHAR